LGKEAIQGDVKVIHTDGERSLGDRFHEEKKEKGLKIEISVPHTPEQNDLQSDPGKV
jgi:hypothetical protein